jgi:hypothetical protein
VKFPTAVILLIAAALGVLFLQPFVPYGDAIRPGLGDLMNGVAGLILLIAALIWALIARKRG